MKVLEFEVIIAGVDRARNQGLAPCQGLDAEGVCPLGFCSVIHNVLVDA